MKAIASNPLTVGVQKRSTAGQSAGAGHFSCYMVHVARNNDTGCANVTIFQASGRPGSGNPLQVQAVQGIGSKRYTPLSAIQTLLRQRGYDRMRSSNYQTLTEAQARYAMEIDDLIEDGVRVNDAADQSALRYEARLRTQADLPSWSRLPGYLQRPVDSAGTVIAGGACR